jgi:Flp pilus assembly protein TadG
MKKRAEQTGARKRERGSILALSSVAMLAVLLAVGLGVDISRFYLSKAELQNAADAAALAGVSGLNGLPAGVTDATNRAVAVMNKYDFNHTNVAFPRGNVEFAVNLGGPYMGEDAADNAGTAEDIRFVRVTTPASPVGVSIVSFVLGDSKNLSAKATAGKSVTVNVICPWLPAFILDDPLNPITEGGVYTFRLSPGGAISPGNYQLLAPIQSGGSGDREGMANGVHWCISAGQVVKTKPGVTAGAVRQGINTRFGIYAGGLDPVTSPPDTNVKEGIFYRDYGTNVLGPPKGLEGEPGRRIVFIPIAKNPPAEGRDTVTIDRFGVFFLQTSVGGGSGGELKAEFIRTDAFAADSYFDPGAGPGNINMTVPVLYK